MDYNHFFKGCWARERERERGWRRGRDLTECQLACGAASCWNEAILRARPNSFKKTKANSNLMGLHGTHSLFSPINWLLWKKQSRVFSDASHRRETTAMRKRPRNEFDEANQCSTWSNNIFCSASGYHSIHQTTFSCQHKLLPTDPNPSNQYFTSLQCTSSHFAMLAMGIVLYKPSLHHPCAHTHTETLERQCQGPFSVCIKSLPFARQRYKLKMTFPCQVSWFFVRSVS